jgi:FkbM family methyltransferase
MSAISLHRTLFGSMFHAAHDECIGQSLEKYGQWALDEISLLFKIINFSRSGDFIDMGANVGTHTIAIGKLAQDIEIHSFEAQSDVFQILCANALINKLTNVRLHHYLLGDKTKMVRISTNKAAVANNIGAVAFRVSTVDDEVDISEIMTQVAVDDVYPKHRTAACVKADLEGMEYVGLRGAAKTIDRCLPAVYFENNCTSVADSTLQFFASKGYSLYWHVNFPFDADNFKMSRTNIFGTSIEVNVLCLHVSSELKQLFESRMTPASQAFTDDVQNNCRKLNAEMRKELRDTIKSTMSDDLFSETHKQLEIDFCAIREDRIKAQEIMENQLAEIGELKRVLALRE